MLNDYDIRIGKGIKALITQLWFSPIHNEIPKMSYKLSVFLYKCNDC